jgi:hypothetical protein
MKTSELIKLLQKEDPDDQCFVCIDNHPVSGVGSMAYYWDGRLESVVRDENHLPIKAGYPSGVRKMKIFYDSLEEALMDNPNVELDLSGITYNGTVSERHMASIESWKKEGKEFQEWKNKYDEAYKRGEKFIDLPMPNPKLTWKKKLGDWLEKIGLISRN